MTTTAVSADWILGLGVLLLVTVGTAFGALEALDASLLTQDVMQLSLLAAQLSDLIYTFDDNDNDNSDDNHTTDVLRHTYFESVDGVDAAMISQTHNGQCLATFRGTIDPDWTPESFQDSLSNLFPLGLQTVCGDRGCCRARKAYVQTYYNDFERSFREALEDCIAECTATTVDNNNNNNNPTNCLVLTGHSQGGAVAQVASISYAHHDPWLITFGQPAAIGKNCDVLTNNQPKSLRFINTVIDEDSLRLKYDLVPFLPSAILGVDDDYGKTVVLSPSQESAVTLVDATGSTNAWGDQYFLDWDGTAHTMASYISHIESLTELKEYPIPEQGWKTGRPCGNDDECISGACQRINDGLWFVQLCLPEDDVGLTDMETCLADAFQTLKMNLVGNDEKQMLDEIDRMDDTCNNVEYILGPTFLDLFMDQLETYNVDGSVYVGLVKWNNDEPQQEGSTTLGAVMDTNNGTMTCFETICDQDGGPRPPPSFGPSNNVYAIVAGIAFTDNTSAMVGKSRSVKVGSVFANTEVPFTTRIGTDGTLLVEAVLWEAIDEEDRPTSSTRLCEMKFLD